MKNNIFLLLSALITVFLGGCVVFNNDFDVHIAYFNNASSHNIYVQKYSKDHNNLKSGNFFAYGASIPHNTNEETVAPYEDSYLEKILFVDTNTHRLLKKITGTTYYNMLSSPKIVVENNTDGGKTTYYIYYFVITDEFLNDIE